MRALIISILLWIGLYSIKAFAQEDLFGAYLDPMVDELFIPGYYLAVFDKSGKIYERGYGFADALDGLVPSGEVLYSVQSLTKPLTSLLILRLVDQGLLELSAPLSKYLPEFEDLSILNSSYSGTFNKITIENLLTHTSGLTYSSLFNGLGDVPEIYRQENVMPFEGKSNSSMGTLRQQVGKLSKLPLKSEPGERFEYSVSLDVLGRVAEVVSGESLSSLIERLVFDPLEMRDSYFSVPDSAEDKLSRLYSPLTRTYPIPGNYKRFQEYDDLVETSKNFGQTGMVYESGGHGIISSANDYGKFLRFILNYEATVNSTFLSEELFRSFLSDHIDQLGREKGMGDSLPELAGKGFSFGLGIELDDGGDFADSSTYDYYFWDATPEWAPGVNSHFWIDKDLGLGLVYFGSLMSSETRLTEKTHEIAETFFGKTH